LYNTIKQTFGPVSRTIRPIIWKILLQFQLFLRKSLF